MANNCQGREERKTMTLNLTVREMQVVEELSAAKDLSKTGVIRQALRLYQHIDRKLCNGQRMFFKDENGAEIVEQIYPCMVHLEAPASEHQGKGE